MIQDLTPVSALDAPQPAVPACRPIHFASDFPDYPYWGVGSGTMIRSGSQEYLLTAQHVMNNQAGTVESLRVLPSDASRIFLGFNQGILMKQTEDEDDDYQDLFLLRIDMDDFGRSTDAAITSWNMDTQVGTVSGLTSDSQLFVVGNPTERRYYDSEKNVIGATCTILAGRFAGESVSKHCYRMQVQTNLVYESYDGFSGGAVFTGDANEQQVMRGMVIRGTTESETFHFIDGRVISEFLRISEGR
jgi:hypothetical protein